MNYYSKITANSYIYSVFWVLAAFSMGKKRKKKAGPFKKAIEGLNVSPSQTKLIKCESLLIKRNRQRN